MVKQLSTIPLTNLNYPSHSIYWFSTAIIIEISQQRVAVVDLLLVVMCALSAHIYFCLHLDGDQSSVMFKLFHQLSIKLNINSLTDCIGHHWLITHCNVHMLGKMALSSQVISQAEVLSVTFLFIICSGVNRTHYVKPDVTSNKRCSLWTKVWFDIWLRSSQN